MPKLISLLPGLGVGVVVGVFSGLLGIGGGILMVPLMVYFWHHEMKMAVATSLAVMIPTALASTVRNASFGTVDWSLAAVLAVGAIFGAFFIGAPLAHAVPGDILKRIFGFMLIVTGLQMAGAGEWVARLWK